MLLVAVDLCHMQIDISITIVERAATITRSVVARIDPAWLLAGACLAIIQRPSGVAVLREVLRSVRIEWVTLVDHPASVVEHIVSMSRPVRLTNSTEIDVDVAVRIFGRVHVVSVCVGYAGLFGNRLLVVASLLAFRLDFLESRLEGIGGRIELGLGVLERDLGALVLGLGGIERTLACIELGLGPLEIDLCRIMRGASRADFFDEPATLDNVTLSFFLIASASAA